MRIYFSSPTTTTTQIIREKSITRFGFFSLGWFDICEQYIIGAGFVIFSASLMDIRWSLFFVLLAMGCILCLHFGCIKIKFYIFQSHFFGHAVALCDGGAVKIHIPSCFVVFFPGPPLHSVIKCDI